MQLERVRKNHMDVEWHEYTDENGKNTPVINASITEKASIIGRVGIMFLSCGTGAWRVRSSMNALAEAMGITCTTDIGLMSIEYTCFDGENGFTQSLCLTNTGVNTSKLNRLEHFIRDFETEGKNMSGEELHSYLDEIERIHGLYSPVALGLAAAIACCGFTFLLGGGLVEMFCAFVGAGLGNFFRCKLTKHHFTLFLGIVSSVSLACFVYAGLLKLGEILFGISIQHEAGYICAMLFIIPGFPFITSGYAFWHGKAHLCTDHCSGSRHVCLDHGYAPSPPASGFHKDPYVCCNVDPHTACCKLFRRVRFFHHV